MVCSKSVADDGKKESRLVEWNFGPGQLIVFTDWNAGFIPGLYYSLAYGLIL